MLRGFLWGPLLELSCQIKLKWGVLINHEFEHPSTSTPMVHSLLKYFPYTWPFWELIILYQVLERKTNGNGEAAYCEKKVQESTWEGRSGQWKRYKDCLEANKKIKIEAWKEKLEIINCWLEWIYWLRPGLRRLISIINYEKIKSKTGWESKRGTDPCSCTQQLTPLNTW